jgi:hypothetical protein
MAIVTVLTQLFNKSGKAVTYPLLRVEKRVGKKEKKES